MKSIRMKLVMIMTLLVLMPGVVAHAEAENSHKIKKLVVFGDSMTGWLAERINAYGKANGFEVATVVWDGATLNKYASSGRLEKFLNDEKADAVMVCLGMNEMLGTQFERLNQPLGKILEAVGDRDLLWVGPPSWPGRGDGHAFNTYMKHKLGEHRYFDSSKLKLSRQSAKNPHPTRAGMNQLADEVMRWNARHNALHIPEMITPAAGESSKSRVYVYKRMKEKF